MSLFSAEKKSGFHEAVLFLKNSAEGKLCDLLQTHPDIGVAAEHLIQFGSVYVNQIRVRDPGLHLKKETLIRVHSKPRRYPVSLSEKDFIAETDDFILVWKPAHLPTHATVDNAEENTLTQLQKLRPGALVLNRLDLETEGFLVFAKNPVFQTEFNEILRLRKIEKRYQALVDGHWNFLGHLEHEMVKSFKSPKQMLRVKSPETQTCQMRVLRFDPRDDTTALEIQLITGRAHQIRAQCAFEGHPLTGDVVYGSLRPPPFKLICSHLAWSSQGRLWEFSAEPGRLIF